MIVEVAQGVVAARHDALLGAGVAGLHLAPVQNLVAGGDDGQQPFGVAQSADLQRAQLVYEMRLKEKAFGRSVPTALLADLACQVARRVDRRVDQHSPAVASLGQPGGVKAAQG